MYRLRVKKTYYNFNVNLIYHNNIAINCVKSRIAYQLVLRL